MRQRSQLVGAPAGRTCAHWDALRSRIQRAIIAAGHARRRDPSERVAKPPPARRRGEPMRERMARLPAASRSMNDEGSTSSEPISRSIVARRPARHPTSRSSGNGTDRRRASTPSDAAIARVRSGVETLSSSATKWTPRGDAPAHRARHRSLRTRLPTPRTLRRLRDGAERQRAPARNFVLERQEIARDAGPYTSGRRRIDRGRACVPAVRRSNSRSASSLLRAYASRGRGRIIRTERDSFAASIRRSP